MKRSWLIQRLTKPRDGFGRQVSEAFAFGGGLRNGGLSDDAMTLLRGIFAFDYMGASEFEWGAVPKALQGMAAGRLAATAIDVAAKREDWRTRTLYEDVKPVYVVCALQDVDEVHGRIRTWAASDRQEMKEQPRIAESLLPSQDWHSDVQGWLELDNGFAFFADRSMWESFCAVFGVKVPAVTK